MKKLPILSFAVLCIVTVTSCSKIKEALFPTINIDLPAFQFSVPAIPIVLNTEVSLGSFTMQFNLDSIIRANTAGAFGAGAVSTIKVKQMVISIPNGDQNNNLANFESARFTFSSNTRETPAELLAVAFPDTFSTSTTIMPANSPELKEYLNGTQLTYTLYGKARRTTNKPLTFNIVVTLSAK